MDLLGLTCAWQDRFVRADAPPLGFLLNSSFSLAMDLYRVACQVVLKTVGLGGGLAFSGPFVVCYL